MENITAFFWFCSGAHTHTLGKYPTEHNKYFGIGATIFFTALFAGLSAGYAMFFVFSGNDFAVVFAIIFAIIWALAIFNMDRYIVSSINKQGSAGKQFLQALPRILLAIMIGVVISRPLELKIFDKEIRQQLKTTYLSSQRSKIDTLQSSYNLKYKEELTKYTDLTHERDSLTKDINRSRYQLNQEVFGDKSNQTSGIKGYGIYAKQKEAVLAGKEDRLKVVQTGIDKLDDFLRRQKASDGLNNVTLFTSQQLDSLSNTAGFADRNRALGLLSYLPNGKRDWDTYFAESFIAWLFILFECLPVFVKLMTDAGPYDLAMKHLAEAANHLARTDGDMEQQITDDLHKHRYDATFNRRKQSLQ